MMQVNYLDYVQRLAQNNPYSQDPETYLDQYIVWKQMDFCLTSLARELIGSRTDFDVPHRVGKYNLEAYGPGELCEPFIEELEQRFEAYGVGWCTEPLIPIRM